MSDEIDKLARPLRQSMGHIVEFRSIEAGHHKKSNDSSAIGVNAFFEINSGDEAAFNHLRDKAAAQSSKEEG